MFEKSVLPNGLRVISSSMPHTRSASVSLFVGAGGRYEANEVAGVSHFLEHILFKGTERRPTAQLISEEIESVGGVMNAATEKELTVYYAKVGDEHVGRAVDVLSDNLCHSLLEPAEIDKERKVILEELAMTEDSPSDLVGLLMDEVMWPDQPLGRDVGGNKETVSGLERDTIEAYLRRQYVPENIVLSVAGNITHEQVLELAHRNLGDRLGGPSGVWEPAVNGQTEPRVGIHQKRTEQAHICLALPGLSATDPDRYTLGVLNTILGEGMSSRLFLEIRERLALAYDVASSVSHYQDAGAVVLDAAVPPKQAQEAIRAMLAQIEGMKQPVPDRELRKARDYMKGRMQLRLEDTRAVSGWLGGQELLRREIFTVDQVLEQVERVTSEDVKRVATRLFRPELLNLAVVGPFRSAVPFERVLRG
ncbi:MAG: insulinase family protein [Chloroflexi bacterium]|nr:insulinase family protein [Chloroflexota bacterium]